VVIFWQNLMTVFRVFLFIMQPKENDCQDKIFFDLLFSPSEKEKITITFSPQVDAFNKYGIDKRVMNEPLTQRLSFYVVAVIFSLTISNSSYING